ncbi:RNA-directed DNA polymerase, eukaryota [Tanacetum coccineum]
MMCVLAHISGLAKLLCQAKLIIWDEASMAKRQAVEAVDRTMQDIIRFPGEEKVYYTGVRVLWPRIPLVPSEEDIVNQKRRTLSIHGIKHDGLWLTDPPKIKDAFHYVFEAKFKKKDVDKIVVRSPFYSSLHEDQNTFLVSFVTNAETHAAICDCGSKKSSGPEGFTFAFYKKFWDLIKSDVTVFVQEFLSTSIMPKGCNTSFIASYPKVFLPMVVMHFMGFSGQMDFMALFNGCLRSVLIASIWLMEVLPSLKFSKRLSKWKASLLSIGGRTTLLTSVLGAIG